MHREAYCIECYAKGRTTVATRKFYDDDVCERCYQSLCKEASIKPEPLPTVSRELREQLADLPKAVSKELKPAPADVEAVAGWLQEKQCYREKRKQNKVLTPEPEVRKKESTMEPRKCAHEGCEKKLIARNKSGFCTEHFYDSKRKSSTTGSSRHAARKTVAKRGRKPRAQEPAKSGIATICVSEAHLDNFWSKLSLDEKAEIFTRQLEG